MYCTFERTDTCVICDCNSGADEEDWEELNQKNCFQANLVALLSWNWKAYISWNSPKLLIWDIMRNVFDVESYMTYADSVQASAVVQMNLDLL